MLIGVPKEIKVKEFRVGMTPTAVREVTARGHKVIVETGCGTGIGMDDAAYEAAGAEVLKTAQETALNNLVQLLGNRAVRLRITDRGMEF